MAATSSSPMKWKHTNSGLSTLFTCTNVKTREILSENMVHFFLNMLVKYLMGEVLAVRSQEIKSVDILSRD